MSNDFTQTGVNPEEPDFTEEAVIPGELDVTILTVDDLVKVEKKGENAPVKKVGTLIFGLAAVSVLVTSLFLLASAITETGGPSEIPRNWAPGSIIYLDEEQVPVESFDPLE